MTETLENLLRKGDRALQADETVVAMVQFEMAHAIEPRAEIKSKLAYCLAKERRQFQKALALCREALQLEPNNPDHYYQLSRVYLVAGQKRHAIKSLRKGLKFQRHQPSIDALTSMGLRKTPVFPSLPREHALNRLAGRFLAKFGVR